MKQDNQLYHTSDLALLWNISNTNTLYTTVKRYIDRGILIPVYKGLYATVPLYVINPIELGVRALHAYAYVSCEYILQKQGIIFQNSSVITLVSSVSKQFSINTNLYKVRKIQDRYLFNSEGINLESGIPTSTLERAVADMLYFNPRFHFDAKKSINWKRVRFIQKEVGYI